MDFFDRLTREKAIQICTNNLKREREIDSIMTDDGCDDATTHYLWDEMESLGIGMASLCTEFEIKTDFQNYWNQAVPCCKIFS